MVKRLPRIRRGSMLTSAVSTRAYVIEDVLAEGGFGTAYVVRRGRRRVCLKVTADSMSWHREAYMAELLHGHPRVIQVYETFPVYRGGRMLYAVAMELAYGAVAEVVDGNPWRERRAVSQIRGLLDAVDQLHASGALHRDITPFNVYVTGADNLLKLGDFGIARHGPKKGVPANAFNPWFVDEDIFEGSTRDRQRQGPLVYHRSSSSSDATIGLHAADRPYRTTAERRLLGDRRPRGRFRFTVARVVGCAQRAPPAPPSRDRQAASLMRRAET